jgi:release factor glutamine methyltransferase
MDREPVAYIIGEAEFRGLTLGVTPAVLIPRGDSETVIEAALDAMPGAQRVLDCGTGSGALLLALLTELPAATGVGIDASPEACAIAEANARALALGDRARVRAADWSRPGWADDLGRFDLIVANPPYVESDATLAPDVRDHEPASALFAGPEGLDDYRVLVPQLAPLLEPGGVAVLEIGHAQGESVAAIAARAGFATALRRDLGGRPRALILRRN